MKSILFCAAPLALLAAPSTAQTATTAPATTTANPASRLNLDTPLETIMADDKGKAVVTADIGDVSKHPMWDSFKSMSLNQLAPMSQGKITDEKLKKVGADLAAIK